MNKKMKKFLNGKKIIAIGLGVIIIVNHLPTNTAIAMERNKSSKNIEDLEAPKLLGANIDKLNEEVKLGDKIKISIKAKDDKSEINYIRVRFIGPNGSAYKNVFNFKYSEVNDAYESYLEIDEQMTSGEWKMQYVELGDSVGNISSDSQNIDLSKYKFKVIETIAEINADDILIEVGDMFDPMFGVTAIDKQDGDITSRIEIEKNNVDTTKVGEYEVVYRVLDSKGRTIKKNRKVTVIDTQKPAINIPDVNLKKALNEALSQSENDDITKEQLESIWELDLSNKNISNIEGIQYCKNLNNLYLDNNNISDLDSLSGAEFPYLTRLILSTNQISNISALGKIIAPNLWVLSLHENLIEDISGLKTANFPELSKINLFDNKIKILDGLEGAYLPKLDQLFLQNNEITDISALSDADLPLLSHLDLNNNQISNLSTLGKCDFPKLKVLYIENNQLTNLNGLGEAKLPSLGVLLLSNNYITDISGIEKLNLPNLSILYFANNKINDISALEKVKLPKLVELGLGNNEISDISILERVEFSKLEWLRLSGNQIKDISNLEKVNFPNLTMLQLQNNQIEDIGSISKANFTKLFQLELQNNQIRDISSLGVADLQNLRIINVENQSIVLNKIISKGSYAESGNYLKNIDGSSIKPINIGDGGLYNEAENKIKWNDVHNDITTEYEFSINFLIDGSYRLFNGQVIQPIEYNNIPVIIAHDKILKLGEKFDPLDYITAVDEEDGDIRYKVQVIENTVDTSKAGVYKVVYKVVDSQGATTTKTITVTIKDKEIAPPTGGGGSVILPPADKVEFNDIKNHWAENTIKSFVQKGYIAGYGDKAFKPDNNMTRAEFVKVVNKVFGFTAKGVETFKDVKETDWYYSDVCVAVKAGYINGKSKEVFAPNDKITRQEVAMILTNINNNKDTNLDKLNRFKDGKDTDNWAKSSVEGAIETGYIGGYNDGTIKSKKNITRAEAVSILSRIKK